jgi:hypothetical protein
MPDHSMNATAMRPFGPARMASMTRGLEKAAAYPERCRSNFDSFMLPETSAASTRRRSTRSAAQAGIQPAVAISPTPTKMETRPIRDFDCSARPVSGHTAAAPPRSVMKSRRFMCPSQGPRLVDEG